LGRRKAKGRGKRSGTQYSKEYIETASGVAWYDREQWEQLRDVVSDPARLEDSYEAWVAMAERAISELEQAGMLIERVPIDADGLVAWCHEKTRPIDGEARAEYASLRLREIHGFK
jgi:hypothetical protein